MIFCNSIYLLLPLQPSSNILDYLNYWYSSRRHHIIRVTDQDLGDLRNEWDGFRVLAICQCTDILYHYNYSLVFSSTDIILTVTVRVGDLGGSHGLYSPRSPTVEIFCLLSHPSRHFHTPSFSFPYHHHLTQSLIWVRSTLTDQLRVSLFVVIKSIISTEELENWVNK